MAIIEGLVSGPGSSSRVITVDSETGAMNVNITGTTLTNIDAGSDGSAGDIDIFPATVSSGKLHFVAADNAGDTVTTITNASQAGARTYTIPDAGESASFVMDKGTNATGTFTAATVTTLTAPTVNSTNIDAGASGTAGTVDIFPTTAAMGKLAFTAADNAGNTTTTIVNASQAGARTYTIPDAGEAAAFVMTKGANATATFTAATVTTLTSPTANVTNLDAGASGTAGSVDVFPATGS